MQEIVQFQLLRPWWLLGLLPVVWLVWKAWQIKNKPAAWRQVIAPQFRSLLLGETSSGEASFASKLSLLGLAVIWLLAVIALAGPSLKSVQLPVEKNQQGTVIVLDLSLSMLADDLAPNRLSRVKYKITDLVKQHPERSIGLVGYAGSAHSISPISEDNQTLLGLLPALNPVIMPLYGSNPILGFEQARKLLEGAFINHGHIIWITDDIEPSQQTAIKEWIQSHNYSVSIMPVGTPIGGAVQIPNYGLLKDDAGKVVMPTLPLARFTQFSDLNGVTVTPLEMGDNSVKYLLPNSSNRAQKSTGKENTRPQADQIENKLLHALDEGALLLLLLLPLVALLYRRGWILSLSFSMILPLGLMGTLTLAPTPSIAATELPNFSDLFLSSDQQAYQAWQNKNYQTAEALFEDAQWRASSLYRLGKYAEAAALYQQDDSPKGHYNRGNALAKAGQLEQAQSAYKTALEQQPQFAQAQQNLKIVEQLLQQKSQDKTQKQPSQSPPEEKSESDSKSEPNSTSDTSQSTPDATDSKKDTGQQDGAENLADTSDITEAKKANEAADHATDANTEKANPSEVKQADNQGATEPTQAKSDTAETPNNDSNKDPKTASGTADSPEIEDDNALPGLADSKLSEQSPDGLPAESSRPLTDKENTLTEQQQATRNWLKQIPDEPGLFLKRKFEYQYQQQSAQPAGRSSSAQPTLESPNKQW